MTKETTPPVNRIFTCVSCGHRWVGSNSTCPSCSSFGKAGDEEMTKKIVDTSEDDLRK